MRTPRWIAPSNSCGSTRSLPELAEPVSVPELVEGVLTKVIPRRVGECRRRRASLVLRGEIFLVELDPVVGSESNKTRPAVIVSSNAVNDSAMRRGRGVITIVPVTRNLNHVFPFQVLLPKGDSGLPLDSKAQAEQVRGVSTERLVRRIGTVSTERMLDLDEALRLHFAL